MRRFGTIFLSTCLLPFCWGQQPTKPEKPAKQLAKQQTVEATDAATSGAAVQQTALAFGDLSKVCPNGCAAGMSAIVLDNSNVAASEAIVQSSTGSVAVIQFKAPATFNAAKVVLLQPVEQGVTKGVRAQTILEVEKATALQQRKVSLRGDFTGATLEKCPVGYLSDVTLNSVDLTVRNIVGHILTIEYSAPKDFTPDTVTLTCTTGAVTQPFTVFRGLHTSVVAFSSPEISDNNFCGGTCSAVDIAKVQITANPYDADVSAKLLRVTDGRLWVEITSPLEYSPSSVTAVNSASSKTIYAKRMLGPSVDQHQPFLTYTIMDSETEKRNFGRRIAFNYFAVNVQIHNPTDQKIQLNKARVWFDCDYAEIEYSDLYSNDAKYKQPVKRYSFGIDHVQRQFPHTLVQIVSAFDAQTGKEKAVFDGLDLTGAILSALTGVFNTTQYSVAANVFTGIAVPGFRKIIMNPDQMNQMRASLVSQALDSIVQVPAKGAGATLVFLPRKGILAWQDTGGTDKQIPVVIDLVRDIHFEPEIVIDTTVSQGPTVTVGMTEDQVKKVLGDPTTRNEANDTLTYTYSTGPYKEVDFKKDTTGTYKVSNFAERPAQEQITEGKTTLAEAERILGASRADVRDATDGGKIWINAPLIGADLRFGTDNVLVNRKYQNAFSVLKQMEKQTMDKIVQKAEDLSLNDAAKTKIKAAYDKGPDNGVLKVQSPDLTNETIVLRCDPQGASKTCTVTNISNE